MTLIIGSILSGHATSADALRSDDSADGYDRWMRLATAADIPALRELIEASVRGLQAEYTAEQREAALGTVFGVDSRLIADGTYYLVEVNGLLAGCGGWSKRKTLFGADAMADREDDLLDPATDAAKIRAFFVHPDFARRGIGTQILEACEAAAITAGFSRFELGATLAGVKLYERHGYEVIEQVDVVLDGGVVLPVVRMGKGSVAA